MPEMKTQRSPAAKKEPTARKPRATQTKHDARIAVERTTDLSEDLFQELEDGAQRAIEAVRKFLVAADEALPPRGEGPSRSGPSRSEEITDSALEMAQRLAHTQYDFLRKVVDSAGRTLTRSDDAK
ncbi:MAG: hypothetical protein ABSG95_15700 [Solirubrobacteraceae bacterium]|jgi:hypothetical protein